MSEQQVPSIASSRPKVALITGSTSGIGLACAHCLATQRVNIILTGLAEQATVDSILQDFHRNYPELVVNFIAGDLSQLSDVNKLCDEVMQLYPDGIDILINNAGLNHVESVVNYPDEKWDEMIAVMLSAPFHLIKRFLPAMKHKGWGRIVNMSSQLGLVSLPCKAVYSAAKFGLIGLTKGVALEVAADGVTCNAVCPGFTKAPVFLKQIEDRATSLRISVVEAEKQFTQNIPTKTMNTVEQVAELVIFLCLSAASSQMTGGTYPIDQGYTAQ